MVLYPIFRLFLLNSILVSIKSQIINIRVGSPLFSSSEGKEPVTLRPTYNIPIFASESKIPNNVLKQIRDYIEHNTCIRIFNKNKKISEEFGINFESDNYCLVLNNNTANNQSTIKFDNSCRNNISELYQMIFRALGVPYEHKRLERDDYITVNNGNIIDDFRKDFEKEEINRTNLGPYDFGSLMHFGPYKYNQNGHKTVTVNNITYKNFYEKMMAPNKNVTFRDIRSLNSIYCNHSCTTNVTCKHGGYQHPNFCNRCKCPIPFNGSMCETIEPHKIDDCGNGTLTATANASYLYIIHSNKCNYMITTKDSNKKIQLYIYGTSIKGQYYCSESFSLQVKYQQDKGNTGLCLCGSIENTTITSEDNSVFIIYRGYDNSKSRVFVQYKEVDK
uniref:Metalloendopeptidase n=1 Tax=Parastrongyloides trichosuri TaxID=131310 RepID=A0A0N4ZDE1_PARTI